MIENESLVELIKNGVNVNDNMLQLYEQNRRFIFKLVKKYSQYADMDDLTQEAFLALYEAVASYKSDTDKTFLTFYGNAIKWRISKYLNTMQGVSLPANMLQEANRYKAYLATYITEHGTAPDDKTIMEGLQIDKAALNRIRTALNRIKTISLNKPLSDVDETELIDVIAGENNTEQIEEALDRDIRHRIISDQIDKLEPLQQDIIHLYYYSGLNDREVSDVLKCPETKTRYVKRQAIKQLRKNFFQINRQTKIFQEYEKVSTGIFHNHGYKHTFTSSTEYAALKLIEIDNQIENILKEIEDEHTDSKRQYQTTVS